MTFDDFVRRIKWVGEAKSGTAAVLQNIVGRFAIYGVNLVCGILTARFLGPTGRGEQSAIALWPILICSILTLGIPTGLLYHVRANPERRDTLVSTALIWSTFLGSIAALAGAAFMPLWLHRYQPYIVHFAQGAMIIGPLAMLSFCISALLDSSHNFAASGVLRYLPPFLTLATLAMLALCHVFSPQYSALAYLLPSNVLILFLWPRISKIFRFTLSEFRASTKQLFSYGLRFYGSTLLTSVGSQIDSLLVIGFLSPASLGMYVVALNFSRTVQIASNAAALVVLPKTAGLRTAQVIERVALASRFGLLSGIVLSAGLIAVMPFLLPHLYGRDFRGSVGLSQILLMEATIAATTSLLLQAFLALNRPAVATFLQTLGFATAVPLMLVLVPRIGILGAATSLLASTVVRFVFVLGSFPIVLKTHVPSMILKRSDLLYLRARLRNSTS